MKKDVLFIWIPKSAGYSVYDTLIKYGCTQKIWENPSYEFENKGISTFGHMSILSLIEKGIMSEEYFQNAFKFCFVRNPWDRLASLYCYFKRIKRKNVEDCPDFINFCRKLEREKIPPVGFYNVEGFSQCNPQLDWITDKDGKIVVDFIGRFENLEEDFKKVCEIIGIKEELPHSNKTDHKNYMEYYHYEETKKIVDKLYEKDIKVFNYEFCLKKENLLNETRNNNELLRQSLKEKESLLYETRKKCENVRSSIRYQIGDVFVSSVIRPRKLPSLPINLIILILRGMRQRRHRLKNQKGIKGS